MSCIKKTVLVTMLLTWFIQASANSLYSDSNYVSLHSDKKKLSQGDIVTVLVYEQASASTSAGTDTERDTEISGTLTGTNKTRRAGLDIGSDFSGGGSISREGKLIASVSVKVKSVLSSGDMVIKGQQLIEFNDETQFINIEGTIRPSDISPDNTVLSTRIADARITYKGDGLLGKQQQPGFFSKLMGWLF
ncbi:Flagellar L-ring protein FlgH [gamma proteobacterium IMCC1989]|nr:Flagellar L-ring protein FlgH [gamma proteobacterium IMCC1989]